MDTTMVSQIVAGATQLGMTAKDGLVLWIIYKIFHDLCVGAVLTICVWRAGKLFESLAKADL